MSLCRDCTNYKCRCDSCYALIDKNGKWFCDSAGNYCENITTCDEFVEETGCDRSIYVVDSDDNIIDGYDNIDDYYKAIGKEV